MSDATKAEAMARLRGFQGPWEAAQKELVEKAVLKEEEEE